MFCNKNTTFKNLPRNENRKYTLKRNRVQIRRSSLIGLMLHTIYLWFSSPLPFDPNLCIIPDGVPTICPAVRFTFVTSRPVLVMPTCPFGVDVWLEGALSIIAFTIGELCANLLRAKDGLAYTSAQM